MSRKAALHSDQQLPILTSFEIVDDVMEQFSSITGEHRIAYSNHIYRVLNYWRGLLGSPTVPRGVEVAAAFHDIGLWISETPDYRVASIASAKEYLVKHKWNILRPQVERLIDEHHKIFQYRGRWERKVNAFRQADQIDLAKGLMTYGLDKQYIGDVYMAFPSNGFHMFVARRVLCRAIKNPINPFPMVHM